MGGINIKQIFYAVFLVITVFVVYSNSTWNGFVSDDHSVIEHNPVLQRDALSIFSRIDTTTETQLLPYYRPITYLTFWLELRLHGLNASLMHIFNIFLHSINAVLVYILFRLFFKDSVMALFGGLLFAVHPINSETVNFLSGGRNTLLATMFSLCTYLLHRLSVDKKSGYHFAVLGSFSLLAGLFSKESALMVLPFVVFLEVEAVLNNREKVNASLLRLFPYLFTSIVYLFMRWKTLSALGIQKGIIPGMGNEGLKGYYVIPDLASRLMDNIYAIPKYMELLISPYAMSPRHIVPQDLNLHIMPLLIGWLFLLSIIIWLIIKFRDRITLFGLSWAFIFWLPVSGLFFFSSVNMAERFLYAPLIGIWLVIANVVRNSRILLSNRYAKAMVVLILITLSILTMKRNVDWRDDLTLFTRLVQQYPENQYGHFNLAAAYIGRRAAGDIEQAERELDIAISLDPELQDAYTPMGLVKLLLGRYKEAIYYYTRALEYLPIDRDARINRAIAYERLGMLKEALSDYRFYLTIQTYNNIPGSYEYAFEKVRELERFDK